MSLLKKIQDINNGIDKNDFYPLYLKNNKIGNIHKYVAEKIVQKFKYIIINDKEVHIKIHGYNKLNYLMKELSSFLQKNNLSSSLTGEMFPCCNTLGGEVYFFLDRASISLLGIRGYGVHMNIYVHSKEGIKIWVPKRSKNKLLDPEKFDNSVAGGVAINETVKAALKREAYEEAGISNDIIRKAQSVGVISYCWKSNYSLRPDMLFVFDLKVDEKFLPKCLDGEVHSFTLMKWESIRQIIEDTDDFKINCSLVLIDFFIRHGLINQENEKDYEILSNSLNLGK